MFVSSKGVLAPSVHLHARRIVIWRCKCIEFVVWRSLSPQKTLGCLGVEGVSGTPVGGVGEKQHSEHSC